MLISGFLTTPYVDAKFRYVNVKSLFLSICWSDFHIVAIPSAEILKSAVDIRKVIGPARLIAGKIVVCDSQDVAGWKDRNLRVLFASCLLFFRFHFNINKFLALELFFRNAFKVL